MFTVLTCITERHDWRVLILAVAICAASSVAAMNGLSRAAATVGRGRFAWIGAAAFAFGGGIWATHFIAMLAYEPGVPVGLTWGATILSMVVAMLGALLAFVIALDRGGGAAAAVQLPGGVIWDTGLMLASLGIGAGAAMAGFLTIPRIESPWARIGGAALLTLAVCGMHLTSMAAATVLPGATPVPGQLRVDPMLLAAVIAGVTLLTLTIAMISSTVDRHFSDHIARQATRFRQLADSTFEGVVIHRDAVVLDANATLCRLIGRPPREIIGRRLADLFLAHSHAPLLRHLDEDAGGTIELDMRLPDGGALPVEGMARAIDHDGQPARVMVLRDLRERRAAQDQIRHMAHHDALTGLANRFLLHDRLGQAIAQAIRDPEKQVAVLCLDFDRFKTVNDLLGHAAGDALLQQAAERLRAAVRATDTVARLGGDEFAIVQTSTNQPTAAAALAERLIESISAPYDIDGRQATIGLSIGVAIFPGDAGTAASLLQNADTALYRAKQDGARQDRGGMARFFEPAMDQRLHHRRLLERDLREAIGTPQLVLHYQPLLRGSDHRIVGYEALLRWSHPEHGNISPGEFIPLAEESGAIIPLGLWVLETACAEAARWPAPLSVAINLSPAQFRRPDLVEQLTGVLARTGLDPTRVELEITESVLIDNADQALVTLTRMKALGVRISLDDFGTGYSSLGYLSRFPFDKIKIDQSFVRDMVTDRNACAIVQAIIGLGRSLRLLVTAEGVETDAQLQLLEAHHCDQFQGYLLGRPRPAHALMLAVSAVGE